MVTTFKYQIDVENKAFEKDNKSALARSWLQEFVAVDH